MDYVNISQTKKDLAILIEKVLQGKEIIITKYGKPVAKLLPYQ